MTLSAHFNLALARQFRRIHDDTQRFLLRNSCYMRTCWSVAALARNSHHQACLFVTIRRRLPDKFLRVGHVTFQAARNHGPVIPRDAVAIAGTIHPTSEIDPVGDRELKQPVVFPKKVRLPHSSGANHDIHSFRADWSDGWKCTHGSLVEAVGLGLHVEVETSVGSFQNVLTAGKGSGDRILGWQARGQMMCSMKIIL